MTRLLYFSPVPAGSYAQRPHFLVRACLEQGVESVLWVNPYPCRLPQWSDWRRAGVPRQPSTAWDNRVQIVDVPALPLEPLPGGTWLNQRLFWRGAWQTIVEYAAAGDFLLGIGRPCAFALQALDRLRPTSSFYDAMDNFPEFHQGLSRRAMQAHEEAIANRVDRILASSTFLTDKFARRGLPVEKLLNGFEPDALTPCSHVVEQGTTVLGYVGCIGRWFDWPLVIQLAKAMPSARIELVGPCVVGPPEKLPGNVRMLPACRHSEVRNHLERFSAGLIPFVNDALTAGVDPIKFYEYRAAGLPILSTSFGEMVLRGAADNVYFLDQSADIAATVGEALNGQRNVRELRDFARENSWASRFYQSNYFQKVLPASVTRRAA